MPEMTVADSRRSWLHRLGRSAQGVLAGALLLVVGFPVLWWNEGRAVRTARAMAEGASEVISVGTDTVDPGHEGRLVHVTGEATTAEMISDPPFCVAARALRLRRTVEMYQWREESRSKERTRPSGGSEEVTSTTFSKVWSERLIDSSGFTNPVEHRNPASMPVTSEDRVAGRVALGAFTLASELVLRVDRFQPVRPATVPAGSPRGLWLDGASFFIGADPARPEVGDLRVRFAAVTPTTVSVVARQKGVRLEPYLSRSGRNLDMLELGTHTATEMFAAALSRNRVTTWLLRLAGAALLFVGLATALRPLAAPAEVVPLLGPLLRLGLGLAAAVVAFALTVATVGMAWVSFRPLVGAGLVAGAAVVVGLGLWWVRRRYP